MYDNDTPTIYVNVKGSAASKFTRASMSSSVVLVAATGPLAKEKARPIIESIQKVVVEYKERAKINVERLRTTFQVEPNRFYRGNETVFDGYKATYTIKFDCLDVVEALAVHDALTSLTGISAETPVFHMDNDGEVANAAFKDAAEKAKAKFKAQCEAVGIPYESYYIRSWTVEDEIPRGKTLSMGSNAKMTSVEVEPGQAMLDVTVKFAFSLIVP